MLEALKEFSSRIVNPNVTWDNIYEPQLRISKTIQPDKEYSFNEISQHIHNQTFIKYE